MTEDLLDILILVGGFLILGAMMFVFHFLRMRYNRYALTEAEILEITPFFKKNSPLKSHWIHCRYTFSIKEHPFTGRSILPLEHFLPVTEYGDSIIIYDLRLELPILILGKERYVGTEIIEHYLLEKSELMMVKYLVRDPSRNFSVAIEELEEQRV